MVVNTLKYANEMVELSISQARSFITRLRNSKNGGLTQQECKDSVASLDDGEIWHLIENLSFSEFNLLIHIYDGSGT